MELRLAAIGGLLLLATLKLCFNEAVVFKLTNAVCTNHNKTLLTFHECRLRAINRNKTVLNVNVTLHHMVHSAEVRGRMYKKANGYKPWLLAASVDGCRFMKKPYNPLAIIVYKLLGEFSSFNHTCPYVGTILVRGFHLRLDKIPNILPTGDYLVIMEFVVYKVPQVTVHVYFEFVEDLI